MSRYLDKNSLENVKGKIKESAERLVSEKRLNYQGSQYYMSAKLQAVQNASKIAGQTIGEPAYALRKALGESAQEIKFSAGAGISSLNGLSNVGVEDITIGAYHQGVHPFLAMIRPMDQREVRLTYTKLVAMGTGGGFEDGDEVYNQFTPLPNLTSKGLGSGNLGNRILAKPYLGTPENPVPVGGELRKFDTTPLLGTLKVIASDSTTPTRAPIVVGLDSTKDGKILQVYSFAETASINYRTAVVTIMGINDPLEIDGVTYDTLSVIAEADISSDRSGATMPRFREEEGYFTMIARPFFATLETSFARRIERDRIVDSFSQAFGEDMAQKAEESMFNLVTLYAKEIDDRVVDIIYNMATKKPAVTTIDLSGYNLDGSNGPGSDKYVNLGMKALNSRGLLFQSGRGATAYLCDTNGADVLSSDSMRFEPTPAYHETTNSLVGTYNNIPVIRYTTLDTLVETQGQQGIIIAVHKNTSETIAPVAVGEFIPLTNTPMYGNFDNPTQEAQALYAEIAVDPIEDKLVAYAFVNPFPIPN